MTGTELVSLVSLIGPFIVATIKKILPTKKIKDPGKRSVVNNALALIVGLAASITNAALNPTEPTMTDPATIDWLSAIVTGLAAGAGMSFVRDADKNFIGLSKNLFLLKEKMKHKGI